MLFAEYHACIRNNLFLEFLSFCLFEPKHRENDFAAFVAFKKQYEVKVETSKSILFLNPSAYFH